MGSRGLPAGPPSGPGARASVSPQPCVSSCTSMCALSAAPGRPVKGAQPGRPVSVNHGGARGRSVSMNIDVCVYVVIFIFSLFAPWHLSHIFLSSDPSSKSTLWYKISHHLTHSTEISQLPAVISLGKCPPSCSGAGGEGPCPLTRSTIIPQRPRPPRPLGLLRFLGCYYWNASCPTPSPAHRPALSARGLGPPLSSSRRNIVLKINAGSIRTSLLPPPRLRAASTWHQRVR